MLSAESLKKIDREISKYPPDQKRSAVMSALIVAQDEKAGQPFKGVGGSVRAHPGVEQAVSIHVGRKHNEVVGSFGTEQRDCQVGCATGHAPGYRRAAPRVR